jgi:hypothetical protein
MDNSSYFMLHLSHLRDSSEILSEWVNDLLTITLCDTKGMPQRMRSAGWNQADELINEITVAPICNIDCFDQS